MLTFLLCTQDPTSPAHALQGIAALLETIYRCVYPYDGVHRYYVRDTRYRARWKRLKIILSADQVKYSTAADERQPVQWDGGKRCAFGGDQEFSLVVELSRQEKAPLRITLLGAENASLSTVQSVNPKGLAKQHGVCPGDLMLKCNNKPVDGMTHSQIRLLL